MRWVMVVILLAVVGCEPDHEKLFADGEKVCYVDDHALTGRIIRGPNQYGEYWVKWLVQSQHSPLLGRKVTTSPFSYSRHEARELVRVGA